MNRTTTSSDRHLRMSASAARPTSRFAPKEKSTSQVEEPEESDDWESEDSPLQNKVKGKWPDLSSRVGLEKPPPAENPPPEGNTFPKKVGTNEWLHGDGRVYKKLMFVIRKDQSRALDAVLAASSPALGEDRSEVVRTLLDHAGIKGGGEATRHLDQ